MTAVTAPGRARRSLLGAVIGVVAGRLPRVKARRVTELAAVARQHVMTFAALSAADLGAFQVWHHGGWFAVAASLLVLDFAVTG